MESLDALVKKIEFFQKEQTEITQQNEEIFSELKKSNEVLRNLKQVYEEEILRAPKTEETQILKKFRKIYEIKDAIAAKFYFLSEIRPLREKAILEPFLRQEYDKSLSHLIKLLVAFIEEVFQNHECQDKVTLDRVKETD